MRLNREFFIKKIKFEYDVKTIKEFCELTGFNLKRIRNLSMKNSRYKLNDEEKVFLAISLRLTDKEMKEYLFKEEFDIFTRFKEGELQNEV